MNCSTNLIEILTRIEQQNHAILAALSAKNSGRFLSVEKVAARLARSSWTVRQLCNLGQICAIKGEDGCWRIPADEFAKLEENGVPKLPKRSTQTAAPSPLV